MENLASRIETIEPINRRRFLEIALVGGLAGLIPLDYSQLNASYQPEIKSPDYKIVGDPRGITETKLGRETINTKYFLKGELSKLPSGLKEEEFYEIIEPLEKKTETLLIYAKASKEKVIKKFKKSSDEMRKRVRKLKDDKGFYTKQDTINILNFLKNLDLNETYFEGTKFVIETGAGNNNPTYTIYDPKGNRITFEKIEDPKISSSVRKFFNFQEYLFEVYKRR